MGKRKNALTLAGLKPCDSRSIALVSIIRNSIGQVLNFECVVKRLRMVLYKSDCDSNDLRIAKWASHTLNCS